MLLTNELRNKLNIENGLQTSHLNKMDVQEFCSITTNHHIDLGSDICKFIPIQDDILISIINSIYHAEGELVLLEYIDKVSNKLKLNRKVVAHIFSKILSTTCKEMLLRFFLILSRELFIKEKVPILIVLISRLKTQNPKKYLLFLDVISSRYFILNCYYDEILKNFLTLKYNNYSILTLAHRKSLLKDVFIGLSKEYFYITLANKLNLDCLSEIDLNSLVFDMKLNSNSQNIYELLKCIWVKNPARLFDKDFKLSNYIEKGNFNLDINREIKTKKSVKLKIAICISGQLRGYEKAFKTWGNLNLDDHEIDYFIHSWKKVGRRKPTPGHAFRVFCSEFVPIYQDVFSILGMKGIEEHYPNFISYLNSSDDITKKELENFYQSKNVILDDDKECKYQLFTNHMKMYYKMAKSFELVDKRRNEYDLVIRIRPDIEILNSPNFDILDVYRKCIERDVIYCDKPLSINRHVGVIVGDQFAIGTPEQMKRYNSVFYETPEKNLRGHVSLVDNCVRNGLVPLGLSELKFGKLLDLNLIDKKIIKDIFYPDIISRIAKGAANKADILIADYIGLELKRKYSE
ncbi:hypothetical protein [Pseudoalteromonas agarivorans]|nr:hypothetical protein [Pseudoalteromonas agarivorans]